MSRCRQALSDIHFKKDLQECGRVGNFPFEMDARCTLPRLCIVVPCYNEEEALPITARVLLSLLKGMVEVGEVSLESCVCFVNDGSTDAT